MTEVHEWTQYIHKSLVLNANRLPHWGKKHKIVADLRILGKAAGRKLGKRFKKVKLDVAVSYPVLWDADAHNYMPTMKHYVDGLVDKPPVVKGQKQGPARGILTDDSDAYFSGPYITGTGERSDKKDHYRFDCRLEVQD
jgi:hypothetical protein